MNEDTPRIPPELWIHIFSFLKDKDKWALAKTSKKLYCLFCRFVGFEYLVIFQNFLHPLENIRDPTFPNESIIETDKFSMEVLEDLQAVRHTEGERYVLHWRASLICLVLYDPVEKSSKQANKLWIEYLKNRGLTIGNEYYITNRMPEWCNSESKILAIVPLDENNEFLLRYTRHELHKISKYLKLSFKYYPSNTVRVRLKVFCNEVNKSINNDENLPENVKICILDMLQEEIRLRGIFMNWNCASSVLSNQTIPYEQPSSIQSLKLYEYQLKGLSWMINIEKNILDEKFKFAKMTTAPGYPALNFTFDTGSFEEPFTNLNNFRVFNNYNKENKISNLSYDYFTTRGGIFADEMGMGKTITILSLITSKKREKIKNDFIPLHRQKAIFETKSNLIICPSHIIQQWKNEIKKYIPSLSVIEISTMSHLHSFTYQSILESDIVIISHQFLNNQKYLKKIGKLDTIYQRSLNNKTKIHSTTHSPVLQHFGWFRIILDEGHEILSKTTSNVNCFSRQEACGKLLFDSFLSDYRWYVSGTPLARGRASLVGALHFLQITFLSNLNLPEKILSNSLSITYEFSIFNRVKEKLFWRNTKLSTANQIQIPKILEEIRLLEFSPIERSMYQAAEIGNNEALMRQICTLPTQSSMGENLSLSEIKSKMNCKYSRDLGESWEQLLQYKETLNTLEKDVLLNLRELMNLQHINHENENEQEQYQFVLDRLNRKKITVASVRTNMNRLENEIIKLITQTACFTRLSNVEDYFNDNNQNSCGFCLKQLSSVYIKAICSHIFCSSCFEDILHQSTRCPICFVTLKYFSSSNSKNSSKSSLSVNNLQNQSRKMNFLRLVNEFGTKIASLIVYVYDLLLVHSVGKIIIFSKWDSLLVYLGSAIRSSQEYFNFLAQKELFVICRGSITSRNRALDRFCDTSPDSPSILLLSLNNSASGTHLTLATHIILVDPVSGTKEEALAVDAQALARAHRLGQTEPITATRFIIHSSIDQDDFENVFSDKKLV